jgi:hypothetical protein
MMFDGRSHRGVCFIHIGLEKTGSTAIQFALDGARSELEGLGFYRLKGFGRGNDRLAVALFQNFRPNDDFWDASLIFDDASVMSWKCEKLPILNAQISGIPSGDNLVISSEHFHSRLKTVAEISRLKEVLATCFDEFRVICYLRDQVKVLSGLYSTALKFGHDESLDNFIHRVKDDIDYFDYNSVIERWKIVFGRHSLRVFSYDKVVSSRDGLVGHFSDCLGLPQAALNGSIFRNTKLGGRTARMMAIVNRFAPKYRDGQFVRGPHYVGNLLRSVVDRWGATCDYSKGLDLSEDIVNNIRKFYAQSNKLILDEYGVQICATE